jgi:hypothetical protein
MYNELKSTIKEIKKAKSDKIQTNQYFQYSEYIAEQIDKTMKYSDYLAEQNYLDTSISYYEYK